MQNQFVATFLYLRQQRDDDAIREARPDYVDQQTDRWQLLLLLLCYYCAHLSNPSVQQQQWSIQFEWQKATATKKFKTVQCTHSRAFSELLWLLVNTVDDNPIQSSTLCDELEQSS